MGKIVPVELSRADITQQYHANIVTYKGEPIFVTNVHEDKSVTFKYLISQKKERKMFNMTDFSPPDYRLGMVNVKDTVVFLTRNPVRKMNVGISRENISVEYPVKDIPCGKAILEGYIWTLDCPEIGDTIKGKYPSLEEAVKLVDSEDAAAVAFDRQFCVSTENRVYYKTNHVGNVVVKDGKLVVSFKRDKEFLSALLGEGYAKTVRISCN